jgi:hypothetical protein
MKTKTLNILLVLMACLLIFSVVSCGDDDDDDDNDDDVDDDVDDDDDDDDNDDDAVGDAVPTTLDLTLVPVQVQGDWALGMSDGEPFETRNDLNVVPTNKADGDRLSMAYFMTFSDTHQTDEESPTRLSYFDSLTVLEGTFDSAYRPQEDLGTQLLNSLVRTANRIQTDYERDFDFALQLGDATDNAQANELMSLIDALDGGGITTGTDGWTRADSGDFDIDPATGLNNGERDLGIQEENGAGENINAYNRPGYPNSNADVPTAGLQKADGTSVPWFFTIGNHDARNTGNFDPDSSLTFYTRADYLGDMSPFGFIPGIGATLQYWKDNPGQKIYISDGIFGLGIEWSFLFTVLNLIGLVPDDFSVDIDDRFDLMTLVNNTLEDPSDDGVTIAADPDRTFLSLDVMADLLHTDQDHAFGDTNDDQNVDELDGGYYTKDFSEIDSSLELPVRLVVLNSTDGSNLDAGALGEEQLNWLEAQLGKAITDGVLVILISHHYYGSIDEGAQKLSELLHGCPNVILHLVGHGHRNVISARRAPDQDPTKGYWEMQTPSGVEFPQQGRIIELVDNRDGTGSIYMTLFDHWPSINDDSDVLAELGREVSFIDTLRFSDPSAEIFGGSGLVDDRNRELLFAIPEAVGNKLAAVSSDGSITSVDSLGKRYTGTTSKILTDSFKAEPVGFRSTDMNMQDLIEKLQPVIDAKRNQVSDKEILKSLGYLK